MGNPQIHRRRSIRLRGYDYTRPGFYFVTANTQDRRRVFGTVVNGRMAMNDAGRMVLSVWEEMPTHYLGVEIDEFVVMPDHIHGVVRLTGRARSSRAAGSEQGQESVRGLSLPDVVHRFKTMTTKRYADGVHEHDWPHFPARLWQRNYYEEIIRDGRALASIRAYIRDNPANADVFRYGEPRFVIGNRALLNRPLTAFLASRGGASDQQSWQALVLGLHERQPRGAAPTTIISGFLSEAERQVFGQCLAEGTPMVQVLARGLPQVFPVRVRQAIDSGKLLVMTPFPASEARVSSARAAWCNQYVLHAASRVFVGHVTPGGMLACLLADLPQDVEVTAIGVPHGRGCGGWRDG